MRVLELFSGIGGCAAAVAGRADVVAAVDHDAFASEVYASWWEHPVRRWNLAGGLRGGLPEADLWWMSPPCQPFTVRGARRDLDDRRSGAFLGVLAQLRRAPPPTLALENVPLFEGSRAHELLRETLAELGYQVREGALCPTQLGVPAERNRFYLVASRGPLVPPSPVPESALRLSDVLEQDPGAPHWLADDELVRFRDALHVVDAEDPEAVAACFTSAYGRSPVYAGSYLCQHGRLRRFTPHELLRLLGFPERCRLPSSLDDRRRYKLVGNSLSVVAVTHVLSVIPELSPLALDGIDASPSAEGALPWPTTSTSL